jgi:hypothetical protein
MSREAMQMALEALGEIEWSNDSQWQSDRAKVAITALRQALETEQEPVAWASSLDFDDDDQEIIPAKDKGKLGTSNCDIPLYATPKQWVGLADEEIQDLSYLSQKIDASNSEWFDRLEFARAIESKLKDKNV